MIRFAIPAFLIFSLAVPVRAADRGLTRGSAASEAVRAADRGLTRGSAASEAVRAAEAEKAEKKTVSTKVKSLKNWFKHWKEALDKSAVEGRYRRGARTTAVAAVRGAGQASEDPKKPYWKGGWSAAKSARLMKERRELAAAVSEILEGRAEKGAALLAAFKKAHPESTLLADVRLAESKIDEWSKEAAPAAPEPSGDAETVPAEAQPEAKEKKVEPEPAEKKSADSE